MHEQDIIFHLNPKILMDISDSKIEEYLYNGGHLVIFPNINSEGNTFEYINNIW